MSIIDAISKANAYVLDKKGVRCDPNFARLVHNPGEHQEWWITYDSSLFDPSIVPNGADGAEYIVLVNDDNGDASVFTHD